MVAPRGLRPRSEIPAPPVGRGMPATESSGASRAPTASQLEPGAVRPRRSSPASRVSTATSTGRAPASPMNRPRASGRWITAETADPRGRSPIAASTCSASVRPAGAGRSRATSVPTRSAAWSSCERSHVARRDSPRTAAATDAAMSTMAVPASGRRAACCVASGQMSERDLTPALAARARTTGTTRTPSTVSAATQSTGASVSATSPESAAVAGWSAPATTPRPPPRGAPARARAGRGRRGGRSGSARMPGQGWWPPAPR